MLLSFVRDCLKTPFLPPSLKDTKKKTLKTECFVPWCLRGNHYNYVLRHFLSKGRLGGVC